MATLKIVEGRNAGDCFEFEGEELVIGRHSSCDFVMPDETVSRRHARIIRQGDGYIVEDLHSRNGTLLDGQLLEGPTPLADQQYIQIDDTLFCFQDAKREASTASTPVADATDSDTDSINVDGPDARRFDDEHSDDDHAGDLSTYRFSSPSTADQTNDHSGKAPELRFRDVLKIARRLGSSLDLQQVYSQLLESVLQLLPHAQRCCLLVPVEGENRLETVLHAISDGRHIPAEEIPPIATPLAWQTLNDGKAVLSAEVTRRSTPVENSMVDADTTVRSIMCAPLACPDGNLVGIIYTDIVECQRQFTPEDLELLVSVATLGGQAVENANLHQAQLELDRRERELATARGVQMHLLPQSRPQVPGYHFFDYYRAAFGVGGDYFGYIPLPDGRLAIAVGDVAGKGISAALLMARLTSDVRYCLVTSDSPAAAVQQLNHELPPSILNGRFVTFALCVLDPETHELIVVNAGHMPPLLRSAATGQVEQLAAEDADLPIGLDPDSTYQQVSRTLDPGDSIIMYTDGVSEARDADGNMYRLAGLCHVLESSTTAGNRQGPAMLQDLLQFMDSSPQRDDVCLMCFGRHSHGEASAQAAQEVAHFTPASV